MTDIVEKMRRFTLITEKAVKIQGSGADPVIIYETIFCEDGLAVKVAELGLKTLDYCDPETGYEDEVKAYVDALRARSVEYQKILDAISET